jgi:hypothetical protein
MTGHQPVVFHAGLVCKYETVQSFADAQRLVAVSVLIDSDEGDAGAFAYPKLQDANVHAGRWPQLQVAETSWSTSPGLHSHSRLRQTAEIDAVARHVAEQLRSSQCVAAATAFESVAAAYLRFAGRGTLLANTAVRRAAGIAPRMLEIPLSVVCRFPEVQFFWRGILEAPREFADCCNATLKQHRERHNIRNEANPFPSLRVSEDGCELPFWIVDQSAGIRRVLDQRAAESGIPTSDDDLQWIPRGPLISATLRLLFADLFVHGTGGGTYDQFTDELIRTWWKVEPPPFAVVSGSRYLFELERAEYRRCSDVSARMRELQFHPQRFFGTGDFPAGTESRLRELVRAREDAVAALKRAREIRETGREPARQIQELADAIRETVAAAFAPVLTEFQQVTATQRAVWDNRKWPWFFFQGLHAPDEPAR